ncbi:molecular chaperone HscC [Herbaspirillum rubrisubalbicans]|uniref:molecular chaperone HscC n=1 Tax=Herbaspirillum rubrisubalbicans TaxID=80842 RepID=UPI001559187B|nr:molecular chaperone HscC [Herbaspirillum rubrisubalbicans]NQE50825.1 2-alkenal reductase [Herbaspirillum rubrisubalbicans]
MTVIVGIDLGTTNSLIAVWEHGRSRLIANSLGEFLTPSCVSVDEDGSILVGKAARERLQTHPHRTAAVFKRYMGSNKTVRLGQRDFRPEELSALVLRSLKADAEAALGVEISEAVITVPAYFSDAQRKATRDAGRLAGLKVERLLNEPTAAALAYGIHQRESETKFLVVDLGGGTFDVSVLDLFEGVMEVRASAGDNLLGGEDFVQAIVDAFCREHGIADEWRREPQFAQLLHARAEQAKRALSVSPQTSLQVDFGQQHYEMMLDEVRLESICAPLLARLRAPVERALGDAAIPLDELDSVVLAGGATRMPIVRKMIARMFGRFPAIDLNPDEVVALGAAVQAGLKSRDQALKEVVMTDVAPYSMGVEIVTWLGDGNFAGGHMDPVIERNTAVPVSKVKRYFPTSPKQTEVKLNVYQGEARLVRDNIFLGSLSITCEGQPLGEHGIDVRFTYDANGLLQIEAQERASGKAFNLLIQSAPGLLSESEIAQTLARLAELKIHPRDQLRYRTLLARAERLYQQLRGETRKWLGLQITLYEQELDAQDSDHILARTESLTQVLDQLEQQRAILPPEERT